MRSLLVTCVLAALSASVYAQGGSIEYVVSRQPIAGIVMPSNDEPILYQGGFDAADDGFLPPVQLDVDQAVATLVPLTQAGFSTASTLASWFDQSTGKQYVLESGYKCDVVITEAELHSFDRNDPSQVDVIPVPDLFLSDNPETGIAVSGDLYLILRDDYILAGNLSDPLNVVRHDLSISLPNPGMQRFATRADGSIQVADRNTVYTFSSKNTPDVQSFQQEILGLGTTGNDELIVFATSEVYTVDANGQTTTVQHNAANSSFSSFAAAPQNAAFICTYFTPTGDEFMGSGFFANGELQLVQTGLVDATNRAFCMKLVVEGVRQLGVVGYTEHDTKLVVYIDDGALEIGSTVSVALTTAEVEAEATIVPGGDTTVAHITYTPVVTNTSDLVIERLDFDASKLRPWYCRSSSGLFYENLSLQPGETRQLDPIRIYGYDYLPAPSGEVTLQLNAANNLPILPGIPRTYTEYPMLVSTSSAFAKTLEVWPNPATDLLQVDASDLSSISTAVVSDVLGKTQALPFRNGQVDIAHLPKGHYTLMLFDTNGAAGRSVFVKQ
ncbi:MAG: hypothetical protein AB8F78_14555 [Saprospiraceae bacterium]